MSEPFGISTFLWTEKLKKTKEKKMAEWFEIDLWTDNIERFRSEFSFMNDVKFEAMDIISQQGNDKRYTLVYRNFGGEKLKFPEQEYYQLKNVYRQIGETDVIILEDD
jgi:hypothetical protein